MRYFIALDLPREIKDYLFTFQKDYKTKDAKLLWTAKKNLHLTLKFLGDLPETKLPDLQKILAAINAPQIQTKLSNIGVFPSEQEPKIIWAGLTPEQDILHLARTIDEETLHLASGEQRFKAHLTLARIKHIKAQQPFTAFLKTLTLKPHAFTLTTFTLYKSTLTNQGPTYTALHTYILSS